MTQAESIRKELEKKNKATRTKIKQKKADAEYREYMDDLGIDFIDSPQDKNAHRGNKRR
jgi:hypothetical protein